MDHFIKCADGKDRQIFPAKIKDRDKIRHFSVKFNSSMAILNILAPNSDKIARAEKNQEDLITEDLFSDEPYNAMMEIVKLAFGDKFSIEEIENFLDVEMISEIIDVFYGISHFKKKVNLNPQPLNGMK